MKKVIVFLAVLGGIIASLSVLAFGVMGAVHVLSVQSMTSVDYLLAIMLSAITIKLCDAIIGSTKE